MSLLTTPLIVDIHLSCRSLIILISKIMIQLKIESNVIPRDIVPDMSSGDDSVAHTQTASGDDSLNRSQAVSGDSFFSHPSDSVYGRRLRYVSAVVGRERVQS